MTNEGQSSVGTILAVVALVAVGVFMFWLYNESSQIEPSVPLPEEDEAPIMLGELAADPAGAVGEFAEGDSVRVAVRFGQGVFALTLPDSVRYPVLMSPVAIQRLQQASRNVYGGDVVYVFGRVYALNDSIKGAWVEGGAVDTAMQGELPSTPSFLLADSVVVY